MKRIDLPVGISALVLSVCLSAMPARAETTPSAPQRAPASAAHEQAGVEKTVAPYLVKVGETECLIIPKGSPLSQNSQRLLEPLTTACLMKASGAISDAEYEGIKGQVLGNFYAQLNTEAIEASDPAAQPLASTNQ